jgi:hypothetical protein
LQPLVLFFLLLGGILPVYAQNGYWHTGASEAGMAYSSSAISDGNLMFHNIGALGMADKASVRVGYDYRAFVEGLNNINLQYIAKGNRHNFGFSLFKSGDDILNEFVASAGIGQQLGIAALGVKVNYYQTFSEAFGYHRAYTISAGGVAELFPDFFWGTYIENVAQYNAYKERMQVPVIFSSGMAYYPVEHLMLSISGIMDIDEPLKIQSGIAYKVIPALTLRTGVNWYYKHMHYGIGFNLKRLGIDYALTPITRLGNVHSLTVQLMLSVKAAKK